MFGTPSTLQGISIGLRLRRRFFQAFRARSGLPSFTDTMEVPGESDISSDLISLVLSYWANKGLFKERDLIWTGNADVIAEMHARVKRCRSDIEFQTDFILVFIPCISFEKISR